MDVPHTLPAALAAFRIAEPSLLLLIVLALLQVGPSKSPLLSPNGITAIRVPQVTPRRSTILSFTSILSFLYLASAGLVIIRAVIAGVWIPPFPAPREWRSSWMAAGPDALGFLAFGGLSLILTWKDLKGINAWNRRRFKAVILLATLSTMVEIALIAAADGIRPKPAPPQIPENPTLPEFLFTPFIPFGLVVARLLVLPPLYFAITHPYTAYVRASDVAQEEPTASTSLLQPPNPIPSTGLSPLAPQPRYGTFQGGTPLPSALASVNHSRSQTPSPVENGHAQVPLKPNARKEVSLEPTWGEFLERIRKLLPFLWPSNSAKLQGLAAICMGIVLVGRVVNFFLPFTLRDLVATFEKLETGAHVSPWPLLFTYVILKFLQGNGGLAALRDTLWAPVMQYSDRQMSQKSFDHLLNLSLAFHTRRKTGEVLRILDRGAAINHVFEIILFNIIPTLMDITVALVAFIVFFDWVLSAVLFVVMAAYITTSIVLTTWRTRLRRAMNDRDVVTRGIHTDCLLNYETVKYFGGEQHEGERYREAIRQYQVLEFKVMTSLALLNMIQNFIISLGLLAGSLLVAAQIVHEDRRASDYIFFITYLAQLYSPLNTLGYIYRTLNQNLVDTERLMKLLDEPSEINDKPGAKDLVVTAGEIEFDHVFFSYDGRSTALNDVSFKVPKGASVALVGESGSGKSTILRLLYRFYDLKPGEGRILIDGQDIRDVTQASLRRAIGVVPQDSVLFNDTVVYNIGYGKFGSTREEIENAARAAQMHDRIMSFPDTYETKVGERGVRLSGGEKQRVSIARTFLKNAPILLLDEATSALDTTTEKDIQKALQNLLMDRSSLSIAHRLSTIASSDVIVVLKDGQIIETGSHRDLLTANGTFAAMWAEQVSADDEAQEDVKDAMAGSIADGKSGKANQSIQEQSDTLLLHSDSPVPMHEPLPSDATAVAESTSGGQDTTTESKTDPTIEPSTEPTAEPTAEPTPDKQPSEETHAAPTAQPVAFPGSTSDQASVRGSMRQKDSLDNGPGVTFDPAVDVPPSGSRPGTPEPTDREKRKRTTSQNLQRLAKRMSIGRKGSTSGSGSSTPSAGSPPPMQREASLASIVFGRKSLDGKEGSVRDDETTTTSAEASTKDEAKQTLPKRRRRDSISKAVFGAKK